MNCDNTVKLFEQYVVPNYGRFPVSLARGEGAYVWDSEGNRYLDLFPGWGSICVQDHDPRAKNKPRINELNLLYID